jgi:hypothetical protein
VRIFGGKEWPNQTQNVYGRKRRERDESIVRKMNFYPKEDELSISQQNGLFYSWEGGLPHTHTHAQPYAPAHTHIQP